MEPNRLEQILDQALALLARGQTLNEALSLYSAEEQAELKGLLGVAAEFSKEPAAKLDFEKFARFIGSLPKHNSLNPSYMSLQNPQPPESIFSKISQGIASWFSPFTLIKAGGGLLAIILIVYGVGSLVVNQLVSGTSYNGSRDSALSARQSAETVALENPLSDDETDVVYGQTTGLSASDPRESMVGRALGAIGSMVAPKKEGYFSEPDRGYGAAPASDTREYLKTAYRSTLKTRQVPELSARVQTIIRGYDGRIDSATTQERRAYISFVVPKDKFDAFKDEITALVPARFITEESVSSQNLLPQKRAIEEGTEQNTATLAQLERDRAALVNQHNKRVKELNAALAAINKTIADLRAEAAATTDTLRLAQIKRKQDASYRSLNNARAGLNNENAQFNNRLALFDNQIGYAQANLQNLAKQDTQLIDTVETVRGSIRLQWISLRDILGLYIPGEWQAIILGLAIIGYLVYRQRRKLESVPM